MKGFGKEKKVTNTQKKATFSWKKKKKADRGKNCPRVATKLEVPSGGFSAPKLPDHRLWA